MPEQVLRIEPDVELRFKGPFNVPSTTLMKLSNPSDKRVCFKIKTTAPKRYCVRPNAGMLQPGATASIAVVFQPCETEPTGNKHKFMVQALFAPEGEFDMDALWKDVDSTKLMDTKLRCTFDTPSDSGNQNDLNAAEDAKRSNKGERDEGYSTAKSQRDDEITEVVADDSVPYDFVTAAETADYDNQAAATQPRFSSKVNEEGHGGEAAARLSAQQETIQLRQENGQLKDEIDRLRRQMKAREATGYSGMAVQNANPPAPQMLQIIMALVVLLVGLIMGKFFL